MPAAVQHGARPSDEWPTGYFLPLEGTNDVAFGLIASQSLACYEAYRHALKEDPEARANFETAQKKRLVLREERAFLEVVEPTFRIGASAKPP